MTGHGGAVYSTRRFSKQILQLWHNYTYNYSIQLWEVLGNINSNIQQNLGISRRKNQTTVRRPSEPFANLRVVAVAFEELS